MEVKIKELRKEYKNQIVLDDVSFNIKSGEVCGLVGINGAGKSTLMKILMGIISKTSGHIYINNEEWSRRDLGEMGAIIESPPIYGNLNAYDNLKVKALVNNVGDERIVEVLKIVDLENTKKKSENYSMGMKMRLGIGMAILHRPKFLILDEPTNGLDPVGIKDLKELIKSISNEGVSILISSHQLKDVAEVSDHIVMINKGKISYDGPCTSPEELEKEFFMIVNRE